MEETETILIGVDSEDAAVRHPKVSQRIQEGWELQEVTPVPKSTELLPEVEADKGSREYLVKLKR